MDTQILVDDRIGEGESLIHELIADGFDVSVALWAKDAQDGRWALYLGSKSVGPSLGDAYRSVYACLSRIPNASIEFSDIKPIPLTNPIARDAIAVRDRQPVRKAIRLAARNFGDLSVEEAYIYPNGEGPMSREEVLQTVFRLVHRPAGLPSRTTVFTSKDGSRTSVEVTGLQLNVAGDLTIHAIDRSTNRHVVLSGDDVAGIQVGSGN